MKTSTVLFLATLLSVSLLAGCAAHKVEKVKQSGFLEDYSGLVKGGKDQAAQVYLKPDIDLKPYTKIMLESAVIWYSDDSKYKGIDPDELKKLADHFNNALINALKDGYQIVAEAGPDVLWIRTAITDVVPGKPVGGSISSILPVGWAVSGIKKATTGTHMSVGQAAVEVEVLDSISRERLAAAVDRRAGKKAPFRGKMEDAEDAFEYWAKRIRQRLDEYRGVK